VCEDNGWIGANFGNIFKQTCENGLKFFLRFFTF